GCGRRTRGMAADGRGRRTDKARAGPTTALAGGGPGPAGPGRARARGARAGSGRGGDGRGRGGPRGDVRGTPGRRTGDVTGTRGTPRILMASDRAAWILSPIGAKSTLRPPRGPPPRASLRDARPPPAGAGPLPSRRRGGINHLLVGG